jgi:hypothetical protein
LREKNDKWAHNRSEPAELRIPGAIQRLISRDSQILYVGCRSAERMGLEVEILKVERRRGDLRNPRMPAVTIRTWPGEI